MSTCAGGVIGRAVLGDPGETALDDVVAVLGEVGLGVVVGHLDQPGASVQLGPSVLMDVDDPATGQDPLVCLHSASLVSVVAHKGKGTPPLCSCQTQVQTNLTGSHPDCT